MPIRFDVLRGDIGDLTDQLVGDLGMYGDNAAVIGVVVIAHVRLTPTAWMPDRTDTVSVQVRLAPGGPDPDDEVATILMAALEQVQTPRVNLEDLLPPDEAD
jgi:hypothetical protein